MKKLILFLAFLTLASTANAATTYYVRVAGGTTTQCLGTTNADYSGSGINQACAYNHPVWALGGFGTAAKMVGGDTLIIDDTSSAQYMVGYGMPNTSGCSASSPKPCIMNAIPSGTDINHPTRILGSSYASGCATMPQLWGTQGVNNILNFYNKSNIDIECVEVTDHNTCTYNLSSSSGPYCSQTFPNAANTWAKTGIEGDPVTNLTLKNLDVHGISHTGIWVGELSGVSIFSHVNVDGTGFTGWDTDLSSVIGHSANTNFGTLTIDHLNIRFSGCVETYPRSGAFSPSNYSNCTDQNGNGQGDGAALYGTTGTINITNSNISHNVQDGWDCLHCDGLGTTNADKNLFEGNGGNQFKFTVKNLNFSNSVVVANCTYFTLAGKVYNTGSFVDCRANGGPFSASTGAAGGTWRFTNNTIYTSMGSGGSSVLEAVNGNGLCTGTETYIWQNNILVSNHSTTNWNPWYSNLSGSCATPFNAPTNNHNVIYNFKSNPAGTGNVFTTPVFNSTVTASSTSNASAVLIQTSSPAKGAATTGTYWNTSTDYQSSAQNSPIDMGAYIFGSVAVNAQAGQTCVATSDCAAGTCSNFLCTGSCTAHGAACSGNTCCGSDTCQASVCAIPATCGDGIIQAGEVCDGSNLGNQSCLSLNFTGGTASCAADCKSIVTSSCTSSAVFPLTPILDSFTRSNSTGISNTSWTNMAGSFNISSNAALPVNGNNATNKYYWSASAFQADEEVYVTMSNKGSNADTFKIQTRYNPATNSGYSLEIEPATSSIFVYKEPGEVQLGATISQAVSSGDSVGMSVSGSTITAYYKSGAGAWTSLTTRTDTTYTGGGNVTLSAFSGLSTPDIKFTNYGGGSLNPITCGNGLKETGEVCDGADLAGQSCLSNGFAAGTVTCASNCQSVITTSCTTASTCGNNTAESGEVCDGVDLRSQTCAGLSYQSGTLNCATDCKGYLTTGCVASSPAAIGGVTLK